MRSIVEISSWRSLEDQRANFKVNKFTSPTEIASIMLQLSAIESQKDGKSYESHISRSISLDQSSSW